MRALHASGHAHSIEVWQAGRSCRRPLRGQARPRLLRRKHVQPRDRCLEGRAGLARGAAEGREFHLARLPVHDRPSRLARRDQRHARSLCRVALRRARRRCGGRRGSWRGAPPAGWPRLGAHGAGPISSRSTGCSSLPARRATTARPVRHRAALGPDVVDRVLDHVERRQFLVNPARKDAVPALVGLLDVELDERAGQLLFLPRRGRLARAKAHDRVLPPHRLAGLERDVLDDAVALVEDPEHGDALRPSASLRPGLRPSRPPCGRPPSSSAAAAGCRGRTQRARVQSRAVQRAYSRLFGNPRLVIAGRGGPDPAAAERTVGAERRHRAREVGGRLLLELANRRQGLPRQILDRAAKPRCQPGATRLPSLSPL